MVENVAEAKKAMRSDLLKNRNLEIAQSTETQITHWLMNLLGQVKPNLVGCYLSFGSEPRTWDFVKKAMMEGYQIACPKTFADGKMEFAIFDGKTEKNALGFEQPTGQVVAVSQLELLIVPALAVDKEGGRLGRGGGFFDRFLSEVSCPIAALILETEFLDSIPLESHDVLVNYAVTPSGIHGF